MAHDQQTYKRGFNASLLGFAVQAVLAVVLLLTSFWVSDTEWAAGASAMYALTWYLAAGIPLWLILMVTFNEHRRERAESLEAERMATTDAAAAAIFDEHEDDLNLSRRRLNNVYKWGINIVGLLTAAFMIIVGFSIGSGALEAQRAGELIASLPKGVNTPVLIGLTAALAFIGFAIARYHAGMTRVKEWQLLRGGAGFLMGNAVIAVLMLVGSVMAHFGSPALFSIMAIVTPILLIVLGIETVLSFLLSFYRPRRPGEYPRPIFDSRLTGWLTSPESLGKIISKTLEFQFGIDLSTTWFYQLISRSVTKLIIVGVFVLFLLSSVVVVGPDQQAFVTRFGVIRGGDTEAAVLGPGMHFKLPWPISRTHTFETGKVHELTVGSMTEKVDPQKALLWGEKHGDEDYLITASNEKQEGNRDDVQDKANASVDTDAKAAGMALLGARIEVKYRITNLMAFYKGAEKPHDLLSTLAEREVNAYFVGQDIDDLIASGRIKAASVLKERIQAEADLRKMGITVVFVGLNGMHPPPDEDVAASFLDQIGALQERESEIDQSKQKAVEIYAAVAGSQRRAVRIADLIEQFNKISSAIQDLRAANDPNVADIKAREESLEKKEIEIVKAIASSSGQAAERMFTARADRWQLVNAERSKASRFVAERAAYEHARKYYAAKLYFDALAEGMKDARKYLITTKTTVPPMIELDLKDLKDPTKGLFDNTN